MARKATGRKAPARTSSARPAARKAAAKPATRKSAEAEPKKKKAAAKAAPAPRKAAKPAPAKKAAAKAAPAKKAAAKTATAKTAARAKTAPRAATRKAAAKTSRVAAVKTTRTATSKSARAAPKRSAPARKAVAPATRKAIAPAARKAAPAKRVTRKVAAASARLKSSNGPQRFTVSHMNEADFKKDGLRPYALYRDLGVAEATAGLCQAHVIRMVPPCTDEVRERHVHAVELQLVYVLKGWMKNEFEGHGEQMMSAGSCWIQPPGIKHTVLDYSADLEVLEIIVPADFKTVAAD